MAWAEQDQVEASGRQLRARRPAAAGQDAGGGCGGNSCGRPCFDSHAEIDEYRQRLDATLDRFRGLDLHLDWHEIAACGCIPPFNLPHQGGENLPLKRKFAAVFEPCFRDRGSGVVFGQSAFQVGDGFAENDSRPPGRRRIGFVVTRGHESLFLKCLAGILNRLPPGEFDAVILCAPSCAERIRRGLQHPDLSIGVLPEQFPAAVAAIQAARCHVLYYWEIGSDALNYFLPFLRLAPVQCTSWSTLVTSGVPDVDYYLSSALGRAGGRRRRTTASTWSGSIRCSAASRGRRCRRQPATAAPWGCPPGSTCTSARRTC